jgi:hypothetical protein
MGEMYEYFELHIETDKKKTKFDSKYTGERKIEDFKRILK